MNAYLVTVPITLSEEQREAIEGYGWRLASDLRNDVMAGAVPTTVIEVDEDSPEAAVNAVARAFAVDPDEIRVEER